MHHARGFHRSWVSYGWDAVPSYDLPLIFSVGGDGNSLMELEVFDVNTRYRTVFQKSYTIVKQIIKIKAEGQVLSYDLAFRPFGLVGPGQGALE